MFWDVLGCSGMLDVLGIYTAVAAHHTIETGFSWHFMAFHGAWNRWKMKAALRDELPSDSASGDEDCGPGEQDQAIPQHPLCTLRTLHTHGGR